jgi:hypothetical protein
MDLLRARSLARARSESQEIVDCKSAALTATKWAGEGKGLASVKCCSHIVRFRDRELALKKSLVYSFQVGLLLPA